MESGSSFYLSGLFTNKNLQYSESIRKKTQEIVNSRAGEEVYRMIKSLCSDLPFFKIPR